MSATLVRIAWRLAVCAAVSWCAWRFLGPVVMVLTLPLFGTLLAKPLLDLFSDMRHGLRAQLWRPEQGHHFAYHGKPVHVIDDDEHMRWIRAADVRAIVGFTASDGALALSYPDGWRVMGRPAQPHFSDTALLMHLRKERSDKAIRFANWAERTIAFPAQRLRERQREQRR